MTSQEKKESLNEYRRLKMRIDRKAEEIQEWRAMATKITPAYSDTRKAGCGGDKIQIAVEKVLMLEEELGEEIQRLTRLRRRMEIIIHRVPDDILRVLLKYRYINGWKWEKIAEIMGYERRHVIRLHGKALQMLPLNNVLECP